MTKHSVSGWAFADNSKELAADAYKTYQEVKALDKVNILKQKVAYGKNEFEVETPIPLSPYSLLVFCDRGNGCFGGTVEELPQNRYRVIVYTD